MSDEKQLFISAFKPELHKEIKDCLSKKWRRKPSKICKTWRNRFIGFSNAEVNIPSNKHVKPTKSLANK